MRTVKAPQFSPVQARAVEEAVKRASPLATPPQVEAAKGAIADVILKGDSDVASSVAWELGAAGKDSKDQLALARAFWGKTEQTSTLLAAARELETALGVNFAAIEQRFAGGLAEVADRLGTALPDALRASFPHGSVRATATGYSVTFAPRESNDRFTAEIAVTKTSDRVSVGGHANREFHGGGDGRVGLAAKIPDDIAGLGAELVQAVHRAFRELTTSSGVSPFTGKPSTDREKFEARWTTWMGGAPAQAEPLPRA